MSNESLIKVFDVSQTLNQNFFDELIQQYEASDNKKSISKSVVIDGTSLSRVCTQVELQQNEQTLMLQRVVGYCVDNQYSKLIEKEYSMFLPKTYSMESFRMKKYDREKGLFDLHTDSSDRLTSNRFVGILIYCNTITKGGETVFHISKDKNLTIKPRCGNIVVFPPFWNFPHSALVPQSDNKYIISTYLQYV